MNRIAKKFQELKSQNEKALITFVTAGDPNLNATEDLVLALASNGADIIELGIPFSDPLADGPIIQKASQRALKAGTNVSKILGLVAQLRQKTEVPLVLMTYVNPLYSFGLEEFVKEAAKVGVDGLIIPDLPFEERDLIERLMFDYGLALIPLIAPTTPKDRIKEIIRLAQGFVYCVSVTGVTGIRGNVSNNVEAFLNTVVSNSNLPVAVGFGISTPEQGTRMAEVCDGVIVGSALVKLIEENGPEAERVLIPLVQSFKSALKAAGGERDAEK